MTVAYPMILLRSIDADWSFARWETLPADGNRYEVIDGVLYMASCPSLFHPWIVGHLVEHVGRVAEDHLEMYSFLGPVGVVMGGCAA